MDIQFDLFENLIKAPSKDYLSQLLLQAFNFRDFTTLPADLLRPHAEALEIDATKADQILKELGKLIKYLLFNGCFELTQIQSVFANSNLQPNLKNLLSKLLVEKIAQFKSKLIENENMVPKLIDFDWRVDIKTASNFTSGDVESKSGQQTCILQLKNEPDGGNNKSAVGAVGSARPVMDIYEIIKQQFKKRSEKHLALFTYLARLYPNDKCGSNGLPLTPNSIRIYGRFQYLKTLTNKYLCRYVDIQRGNHERMFIVSENYSLTLNDLLNDTYIYNLVITNLTILIKWIYQIMRAFIYLNNHRILNRYVHLKYVCITSKGNIKLSNYGLFHMTEYGYCVDFPIVNYVTLAPECYSLDHAFDRKHFDHHSVVNNNDELNIELNNHSNTDVWSFGVILFQFIFGLGTTADNSTKKDLLSQERILDEMCLLINKAKTNPELDDGTLGYEYLIKLYEVSEERRVYVERRFKPIFIQLIRKCLLVDATRRVDFNQLLAFFTSNSDIKSNEFIKRLREKEMNDETELATTGQIKIDREESMSSMRWRIFNPTNIRSSYVAKEADKQLEEDSLIKTKDEELDDDEDESAEDEDLLWRRGVCEVYYLWRLAGGDFLQVLKQNDRLKSKLKPIHKIAIYSRVQDGAECFGERGMSSINDEIMFDDSFVPLSLQPLRNHLNSLGTINIDAYYPMIEDSDNEDENISQLLDDKPERKVSTENRGQTSKEQASLSQPVAEKQPLNIRETDIEYQFHRMIKFTRYLSAYPFKRAELYRECRIDIPPIYRNLAWAALLDVPSDILDIYNRINKEIITSTDRQIDVDIPRCHQYDYLMASPQAHQKLKRILKAWVIANPNLVYWQGLDSLCAPFLYLNFNYEELAFGCLTNFVEKYATRFFLKDNSAVIQEYLAVFSHLIAYHDPELAAHFEQIDFKPDLYAIPWFLTMFAHVFPLQKIFHLWDTLILGSSAFPLCIGKAILKQLRTILLSSDFNECILLFSELPEINIIRCVSDSVEIFCNTPTSCLYREHAKNEKNSGSEAPGLSILDDSELEMSPMTLDQMRSELCPRISAKDILSLYDVKSSKLVLVDIRSSADFSQSHIFNSRNIPFKSINLTRLLQLAESSPGGPYNVNDNSDPVTNNLLGLLQQSKSLVKIILSSRDEFDNCVELANTLVRLHFSRVCILHRGIECFKNTKIWQQAQH